MEVSPAPSGEPSDEADGGLGWLIPLGLAALGGAVAFVWWQSRKEPPDDLQGPDDAGPPPPPVAPGDIEEVPPPGAAAVGADETVRSMTTEAGPAAAGAVPEPMEPTPAAGADAGAPPEPSPVPDETQPIERPSSESADDDEIPRGTPGEGGPVAQG
jgi:hypothetical protein